MSPDWTRFLANEAVEPESAGREGHARRGIDTCVVCDLPGYGLIEASGPDATAFLHGQLSSDVQALKLGRSQLATYNSPKGRVLATLLLWPSSAGYILQLPAGLASSLCKRLSMFVLRAEVRLERIDERYIRVGVAGPRATQALRASDMTVPEAELDVVSDPFSVGPDGQSDWLLKLPGERYQLVVSDPQRAIALWRRLRSAGAVPADEASWQWWGILSGIAEVGPETQDQFVPQMLNYDVLGGISFTKGCYPGQEIVARTQYRGEIKRRTWLLHVDAQGAPVPAQPIHAAGAAGQAVGAVVIAAPAPDGGFDTLACLHTDLADGVELRLGAPDGPRLERRDLPYSLPAAR
jgi:tRNA-modifying protein YgfZ